MGNRGVTIGREREVEGGLEREVMLGTEMGQEGSQDALDGDEAYVSSVEGFGLFEPTKVDFIPVEGDALDGCERSPNMNK